MRSWPDAEEKPSKRSKKESTRGAVAILRQNKVQGCVSQNSDSKESILRKAGELGSNASAGRTIKFSGITWYKFEFGREKGHLEEFSKKANLLSEILARPTLRNKNWREPKDKKIVPAKQQGTWRENIQAQSRR